MVMFPNLYLFVASRLLSLDISGIRPIAIGKVTYWLIAHTLTIQFKYTFAEHFNPQQFGVATWGGCEMVVHGVFLS
jgi:hypothetical protein